MEYLENRYLVGAIQSMNQRQILAVEKKKVAALPRFKSRCSLCFKKFGRYFTFHHLWYVKGEPYFSDFNDNTKYQLAVLPFVKKNPPQFLLLCRVHHHYLEWAKKCGDPLWRRICRARGLSRGTK